jgi:hypothetical protein
LERLRNDIDGMLEDIKFLLSQSSFDDILDEFIELKYGGVSEEDIIDDYMNVFDGKVLDRPSDRMLRDNAMDSLK